MNRLCQITGRLNGEPATIGDYEALFADPCERPSKFSAGEVKYLPAAGTATQARGWVCATCFHYFVNPARADARRVCEIMRPPGEAPVSPIGVCRFWNRGNGFPLLNS